MSLTTISRPASDKQIKYVVDLADKRNFQGHVSAQTLDVILRARVRQSPPKFVAPPFVSAADASDAIDALLRCRPIAASSTTGIELLRQIRPGRYALPRRSDGAVDAFEVVERPNGKLFLNQLLGGNISGAKFHRKYLPAQLQAAAARAISADQDASAKLYADTYCECPRCGAALTHPRSRAARIGKACADVWGWTW